MAIAPQFLTSPASVSAAVRDSTRLLRVQLRAELAAIEALLKQHTLKDEMTRRIAVWHELFCKTLRSEENGQRVLDQFLIALEELLRNPISNTSIDEEPLLGSDQRTYGKKFLVLLIENHQRSTEGIARLRAPLSAGVDEPFSVQPHPIVKHMIVRWLQKYNRHHPSAEEQGNYQVLMQSGRAPPLFSPAVATIRYAAAKATEREQERNASLVGKEVTLLSDDFQARLMARLQIANERIQESQRQSIARADALQNRDRERREKLQQASHKLREEIAQLEREIDTLTGDLAKLREETHAMQWEEKQLECAIKQLEKEIKESRASWVEGVLSTIGIIAACACATWSLGGSAAVIPTKGGIALSIPV